MKISDLPKAVRIQNAFSVFEHALTVGRHWLDQEGVNASYIDALAEAVKRYDEEEPPAPFVVDTTAPLSLLERLELVLGIQDPNYDALGEIREIVAEVKKVPRSPHLGRAGGSVDCISCGAHLTNEEAKEHVVECRGPHTRCAQCDPSFGCFAHPERCCKKPVAP